MDGTHCTTAYFNMYKPPPQLDKCQSAEQVAAYKFKLWPDQHLGSLKNWGESAAFVNTTANG